MQIYYLSILKHFKASECKGSIDKRILKLYYFALFYCACSLLLKQKYFDIEDSGPDPELAGLQTPDSRPSLCLSSLSGSRRQDLSPRSRVTWWIYSNIYVYMYLHNASYKCNGNNSSGTLKLTFAPIFHFVFV